MERHTYDTIIALSDTLFANGHLAFYELQNNQQRNQFIQHIRDFPKEELNWEDGGNDDDPIDVTRIRFIYRFFLRVYKVFLANYNREVQIIADLKNAINQLTFLENQFETDFQGYLNEPRSILTVDLNQYLDDHNSITDIKTFVTQFGLKQKSIIVAGVKHQADMETKIVHFRNELSQTAEWITKTVTVDEIRNLFRAIEVLNRTEHRNLNSAISSFDRSQASFKRDFGDRIAKFLLYLENITNLNPVTDKTTAVFKTYQYIIDKKENEIHFIKQEEVENFTRDLGTKTNEFYKVYVSSFKSAITRLKKSLTKILDEYLKLHQSEKVIITRFHREVEQIRTIAGNYNADLTPTAPRGHTTIVHPPSSP